MSDNKIRKTIKKGSGMSGSGTFDMSKYSLAMSGSYLAYEEALERLKEALKNYDAESYYKSTEYNYFTPKITPAYAKSEILKPDKKQRIIGICGECGKPMDISQECKHCEM